jgi:hypothetical protein
MKIFVGQVYIKAGVAFPFSLQFQKWLGDALSERVEASNQFNREFGVGFGLGLRISAKTEINQTEIKGPTVFKRDKTVEFTIFLPHRANNYHDLDVASQLVEQVLQSVAIILPRMGLDPAKILSDTEHLRSEFLNVPGLLEEKKGVRVPA